MKTTSTVFATAMSLLIVKHAIAADELSSIVSVLATTAARIRSISNSCKIAVDPMLEAQVFETMMLVPGIKMSDVTSQFTQRRQTETAIRGTKCYPEDADSLTTLNSIYESEAANLEKLIENKFGD
ncbi:MULTISPECIES: hypothetical protein [unclassified Rhizobium]|uniref:hypothetical protein n=1 Tax=unclassified Rhizobium TaxID=2613769 RepID=UPI001AE9CDDE|nr:MULTISPECIES: hypothetical protein [unclassified Rhizobium]MBP2462830.1 hypothetical protein [Rhizobium sp. PvP014]MBP2530224.1 hypothetical protein [Rhizobium sp. PvP099]